MRERQKVITLTVSHRWHSILRQQFSCPQRIDSLSLDDLSRHCDQWPGCAAVVELNRTNLLKSCVTIASIVRPEKQLAMFAVGELWLADCRATLASCGFAATCVTASEALRLKARIQRHWNSVRLPELEIEARWALKLPWNRVSRHKDPAYVTTRFSD